MAGKNVEAIATEDGSSESHDATDSSCDPEDNSGFVSLNRQLRDLYL